MLPLCTYLLPDCVFCLLVAVVATQPLSWHGMVACGSMLLLHCLLLVTTSSSHVESRLSRATCTVLFCTVLYCTLLYSTLTSPSLTALTPTRCWPD